MYSVLYKNKGTGSITIEDDGTNILVTRTFEFRTSLGTSVLPLVLQCSRNTYLCLLHQISIKIWLHISIIHHTTFGKRSLMRALYTRNERKPL